MAKKKFKKSKPKSIPKNATKKSSHISGRRIRRQSKQQAIMHANANTLRTKKKTTQKNTKKKSINRKKLSDKKIINKFANILSSKKKSRKLMAAVDIGSNAIRIVVADYGSQQFKVLKKFRFPIRLGADVFDKGKISEKNLKLSARTFKKFSEIAAKNNIQEIRAVGTSALREAKNSKHFIDLIYKKSGIKVEIIDGVEEARLIYQAIQREIHLENHKALLIDVGGGSVELTFANHGMMTATQSFPFGTVRLLEKIRKLGENESGLAQYIKKEMQPIAHFCSSGESVQFAIGTGGNIETLGKLKPKILKMGSETWLSCAELEVIMTKLMTMNRKQRVSRLGLRPDRADVIIPAGLLVLSIMKEARLEKMLIPHVGLKDGLLCSLAQKRKFFIENDF